MTEGEMTNSSPLTVTQSQEKNKRAKTDKEKEAENVAYEALMTMNNGGVAVEH